MDSSSDTTTLQDYLRVLSARKWTVVSITLIAVAIGAAYAALRHPSYDAAAAIQFQTKYISVFAPGVQLPPDVTPSLTAAADSRIVTRPEVAAGVRKALSSSMSLQQLRGKVSTTIQPDSNLIQITASTGNAELSARLANQFAVQTRIFAARHDRGLFGEEAGQLKAVLKKGGLDPSTAKAYRSAIARLSVLSQVADPVEIVRPATVPTQQSAPKPVRDTVLAAILGLIVGIGVAFLRNSLDRRLRDPRQIGQELGLPLVGYIPAETPSLVVGENGSGAARPDQLEAFRVLRTNVSFLAAKGEVRSVVVTSPLREEGKTTVATWYAYACAAAGLRAVLIDCDVRALSLADGFGVAGAPGLAEHLAGRAAFEDIRRSIDVPGAAARDALTLIPAGSHESGEADSIGSNRFREFVDRVTREYDVVVFDAAPLPASDALQIVPLVDAVLLCVRVGVTTRPQAEAARDALTRLPATPIGVVVTGIRTGDDGFPTRSPTSKLARVAGTR